MAEGGPPALQPPPLCQPQDVLPAPPEQPLAPLEDHIQDPEQAAQEPVQPGQLPLSWSYFKPEFSGKPEEDAEAHL